MAVVWNEHRFSGGLLALDTTNTVVLRGVPGMTFDRFDDSNEIARFADHASRFRSMELGGRRIEAADPPAIRETVLEIREATDALFRQQATSGAFASRALGRLLAACASGLSTTNEMLDGPGRPFGDPATPLPFEAALAVSATSLLQPDNASRIKICGNCNWLFLDRSRNSSRTWCDMRVCGNRQKAKRHYKRHRNPGDEHSNA